MPVDRFQGNFYARNDIIDSITPPPWVQERIDRPHGPWRPAPWLPVVFTKTNTQRGASAFVCSSGKVLALDNQGYLVPAGIKSLLSTGTGALAYTATDADWGVIDLVTGVRVTGAVSYSTTQIGVALLERGLVREQEAIDASATVPPTNTAQGAAIIALFISNAIGVALYDMHVWSGLTEDELDGTGYFGDADSRDYGLPAPDLRKQYLTNFSEQHAVQFITEHQMVVPHLATGATAADEFDAATLDYGGSTVVGTNTQVMPTEFWDATNLAALTRYASEVTAATPVIALGLDPAGTGVQYKVARNTTRTPIACDVAGVLVRERKSIADIRKEGDWYLDADLGVLFLSLETWDTLVSDAATPAFSYSYYLTAAADAHKFVHFDDVGRPGDYLTFDAQSNFRVASAAEVGAGVDIVGRLLKIVREPRGLLEQVRTAWDISNITKTGKMPGTATGGYSDRITLSDEVVADEVVLINLRVL